MLTPSLLIVDAANVVGSVPDGWWRDRAAATSRLRDALSPISTAGVAGLAPPLEVTLVVEGAARGLSSSDTVTVVNADGSGDDAIVELVRAARAADAATDRADDPGPDRSGDADAPARTVVVVTADRGLRERVTALGAEILGPRSVPRRTA